MAHGGIGGGQGAGFGDPPAFAPKTHAGGVHRLGGTGVRSKNLQISFLSVQLFLVVLGTGWARHLFRTIFFWWQLFLRSILKGGRHFKGRWARRLRVTPPPRALAFGRCRDFDIFHSGSGLIMRWESKGSPFTAGKNFCRRLLSGAQIWARRSKSFGRHRPGPVSFRFFCAGTGICARDFIVPKAPGGIFWPPFVAFGQLVRAFKGGGRFLFGLGDFCG